MRIKIWLTWICSGNDSLFIPGNWILIPCTTHHPLENNCRAGILIPVANGELIGGKGETDTPGDIAGYKKGETFGP